METVFQGLQASIRRDLKSGFAGSYRLLGVKGVQPAQPREPLPSCPFLIPSALARLALLFLVTLQYHLQTQVLKILKCLRLIWELGICSSVPLMTSCDPVTRPSEAPVSPGCSGGLYDFVAFGKEKLHSFHRDREEGVAEGVAAKVLVWGQGLCFLVGADLVVVMAGRHSCR